MAEVDFFDPRVGCDGGVTFFLESIGRRWCNVSIHLPMPPILIKPYAFSELGWSIPFFCLIMVMGCYIVFNVLRFNRECEEVDTLSWCRGLLLLRVRRDRQCYPKLLLWNPSTRECKEVPNPLLIGEYDYNRIYASALGDRDSKEIEYFDFAMNKFEVVPQPGECNSRLLADLFDMEGCLCVGYSLRDRLQVWVMKEYGVKESWSNWMEFRYGIKPRVYPICLSKNVNVLLVKENDGEEKKYSIYNGKERAIELKFLTRSGLTDKKACTFVESLISL
ncbi:hypothetical protein COLO4_18540 [Corchorus olitorius]|uniref:Uncharacterized protein n=1 Tax=Corchorus olitorius TaxID=93759 RepID=A0A1R3J8P2_9ROSI|nr:hypothetical protein COLO4_18540 [Corchorus olitorius]